MTWSFDENRWCGSNSGRERSCGKQTGNPEGAYTESDSLGQGQRFFAQNRGVSILLAEAVEPAIANWKVTSRLRWEIL
jgi:hypothetical protein